MSAIAQALIACFDSGGVVSPIPAVDASGGVANPATAVGAIRALDDGRIQIRAGGTGAVFVDATNWYLPNTATIGTSFWLKLHKESGTTPTGSALDTPIAISTVPTWTITNNTLVIKEGFFTASIYSDAGGVNLVAESSVGGWHIYAEST